MTDSTYSNLPLLLVAANSKEHPAKSMVLLPFKLGADLPVWAVDDLSVLLVWLNGSI